MNTILTTTTEDPDLDALLRRPTDEEREASYAAWQHSQELRRRLWTPPAGTHAGVCRRFLAHNLGLTLPGIRRADKRLTPKSEGHAKRMWYDGTRLYSHMTPVAAFHTRPDGMRYLLITSKKYSVSTRQHLRHLDRAISWIESYGDEGERMDVHSYYVPLIGVRGGLNLEDGADIAQTHELNLAARVETIGIAVDTEKRNWRYLREDDTVPSWRRDWMEGNDYDPDGWRGRLSSAVAAANEYQAAFLPKADRVPSLAYLTEQVFLHHHEKLHAWHDPKAEAKRKRAKARRLARKLFCS